MPEETEVEETGAIQYAIFKEAVSKELLAELHIRILEECVDDPASASPIEMYVITATGLKKLDKRGYNTSTQVPFNQTTRFVALANPDGSPAKVGIDPAKIKLIEFGSWNGNNNAKTKLMELAKNVLQPVVDRHIKIFVPHGSVASVANDDFDKYFHIYIFSSPYRSDQDNWYVPDKMWGINVPCKDTKNFSPFIEGAPIVTAEGDEIGAIDRRCMYIHHDAVHHGNADEQAILTKIIEAATAIAKNNFVSEQLDVEKRYVSTCSKRLDKRITELKAIVEGGRKEVDNLQKELVHKLREVRESQTELNAFGADKTKFEETLRKEFKNLCKVDKVKRVSFRGDSLSVFTENIYARHPESKVLYDIGEFNIVIDTKTATVKWHNLTRRVNAFRDGMNGPHLFPDGRACLGNMDEVIPKLVAQYELNAAVQMAIAFAETVNLDDGAGPHVTKWPVADEAKVKAAREAKKKELEAIGQAAVADRGAAVAAR